MNLAVWTVLLGAVYLTMLGRLTLADAAIALVVGFACSFVRPRGAGPSAKALLSRLLALPKLLIAFTFEILRGSSEVLAALVARKGWQNVGITEVPIGERSPTGVVATCLAISATPGSVAVDVDEERSMIVVSTIDASNPDKVRLRLERFYQQHQKKVVP